jgi:hypothetical protein
VDGQEKVVWTVVGVIGAIVAAWGVQSAVANSAAQRNSVAAAAASAATAKAIAATMPPLISGGRAALGAPASA